MRKGWDIVGAILAWSAVIVQFILMIQNRQAEVGETIIRFFSYFTILTNTLVAIYFTLRAAGSVSFFTRPGAVTAMTALILVVGIVYQVILRGIWMPTGLQRYVDELLHSLNPLYMMLYFYLFAGPEDYRFRKIWPWLSYPAAYFIVVIMRGGVSGFYPYAFLDVSAVGLGRVSFNFLLISVFTLLLIGALIWTGRAIHRRRMAGPA
ncbi:MAG: Pr6Pr family membrane protein [Lewinella sp.]